MTRETRERERFGWETTSRQSGCSCCSEVYVLSRIVRLLGVKVRIPEREGYDNGWYNVANGHCTARYRVVFLEMFGKDFPKLNLVREAEANEREDQKMRQNEGEKCNIDNILEARGDIKENKSVIAPTRQQDYRPAASDLRNNRVAEWDDGAGPHRYTLWNANVYR